ARVGDRRGRHVLRAPDRRRAPRGALRGLEARRAALARVGRGVTLDGRPPLVIAHRGASGHRPENTLPAFALAVEQRADMIETDLHRTRDGAVVITHDEELAGLGGRGEIA